MRRTTYVLAIAAAAVVVLAVVYVASLAGMGAG
jgi:hypothetical protein